jgi:hypothetical protein
VREFPCYPVTEALRASYKSSLKGPNRTAIICAVLWMSSGLFGTRKPCCVLIFSAINNYSSESDEQDESIVPASKTPQPPVPKTPSVVVGLKAKASTSSEVPAQQKKLKMSKPTLQEVLDGSIEDIGNTLSAKVALACNVPEGMCVECEVRFLQNHLLTCAGCCRFHQM